MGTNVSTPTSTPVRSTTGAGLGVSSSDHSGPPEPSLAHRRHVALERERVLRLVDGHDGQAGVLLHGKGIGLERRRDQTANASSNARSLTPGC